MQNTLRKLIRNQRQNLSANQRTFLSRQALHHFKTVYHNFHKLGENHDLPAKIGLFLSQDGELDTQELIQFLWQQTEILVEIYLPVLNSKDPTLMEFARYTAESQLEMNRFNILQPCGDRISPMSLDWVITPLVAFDAQGNRIGMGGGFYDRNFSQKRNCQKPWFIGWAYDFQKVEQINAQPWDKKLDFAITPKGLQTFCHPFNLFQTPFHSPD